MLTAGGKMPLRCPLSAQLRKWKVTDPGVLDTAFADFAGVPKGSAVVNRVYNESVALSSTRQLLFPDETWMHNRKTPVVGGSSEVSKG